MRRRVTLTFDNGPTVRTTPVVLDHLQKRQLQACFCIVGLQLQAGQEQVDVTKETLARGHRLVNHSLSHGVALGDDPSPEHAIREVTDMHTLMRETLGNWGDPWFRPFGRGGEIGAHILSEAAVSELAKLEYSVLLWNNVPRDWEDTRGWVETALHDIKANDHTVVVLHDLNTGAMDELPGFLDSLLELGYEVTNTFPRDCVPMSSGDVTWPEAEFNELVSSQ